MTNQNELDLTHQQPEEDQLISLRQKDYFPPARRQEVSLLPEQVVNLEVQREKMRGYIALSLVAVLVVIIIFTLLMVLRLSAVAESMNEALQAVGTTVLTPIIGLIGAVTGFYFGAQQTQQTQQTSSTTPTSSGERSPR